jgi:hypothetical protein
MDGSMKIRLAATPGLLVAALSLSCFAQPPAGSVLNPAPTPPMGWNSWVSYGAAANEEQVKANADWMAAHLKPYGWQYITVDIEWFVTDPKPECCAKDSHFQIDAEGRFQPAVNRFPSAKNGAGFKPLADYVHGLGLKFGIHILQGIPRPAVASNLPIADSSYRAQDAADTTGTCNWDSDNYDLKHNAAGQAYYDSIAKMYADWGVDLIKADCIASGPYKGDEIRMLSAALKKTGRPMILSLSPGPSALENAAEMREYAQMWRISQDIWDMWHSPTDFPQGVKDEFAMAAKWAAQPKDGHWPDADMLPLGRLGPTPGRGSPRDTGLTHDEQRTAMTLWCMFRSPLMMAGNLTSLDPWTTSLLTNTEALAIDQHSMDNHPVVTTEDTVVWLARPSARGGYYLAVFNIGDTSAVIKYSWKELGLKDKKYALTDLWEHKELGAAELLAVTLRPHASELFRLEPAK